MTFVLPIPLPESIVTERGVLPKHDFMHRHYTVAFGPDGRGYVHSELFYNYKRYDQGGGSLAAQLVTTLSPDFTISAQVWLEALHQEMTRKPDAGGGYVFNNDIAPLAVTDHGEVVFSTRKNRMFIYDADVRERLARFDPLCGESAGFSSVVVVPGGLVALRDHDQVGLVVDPAPLRAGLPALRDVGSAAALVGALPTRGYRGRFTALDLDRILVSSFVHRGRSGWIDDAEFGYAVLAGDGRVVGHFPLGAGDTPYGKLGAHDESIVTHRRLGAWLVRSDAALHVFDRDGARLSRLGLDRGGRFAPLAALRLIGAAPSGELLLVHEKQHVLVVTDPIADVAALEAALADAAASYAPELSRLKKSVPYKDGRWFGFEAKTPRATAKVGKKPAPEAKAKAKAKAPEPSLPLAPRRDAEASPAQQVSLTPHDLAVLTAYAKSLASSDTALGEYIELGVKLERLADGDQERDKPSRRARALYFANAVRWHERWHHPLPLFTYHSPTFCGLPSGAQLDGLPARAAALDEQLEGLPIQALSISGMSSKDIQSLGKLATLRRITELKVSGSSKHKLGRPLLSWLAEQQLSNLRRLHLTNVATTGAGLNAVIETLPELVGLTVCEGGLTAEGLDEIANTPHASRLHELSLRYTPMGSAVAPVLARFSKLRALNLQQVDLGDDVADVAPACIRATDVDFADNPRFGAKAMGWFVRALPDLRRVHLPRSLPPKALAELLPLAAQLESLEVWRLEREAYAALVNAVLPHARVLRRLLLTFAQAEGLVGRVIEHCELHELHPGNVSDEDVVACARASSLRVLRLGDGASDANLETLARLANFPELHELHVHSSAVTEKGLRRLLEAPWPKLERVVLMYAQIGDAAALPAPHDRPLLLRLFMCKVPKKELAVLRRDWGERLVL